MFQKLMLVMFLLATAACQPKFTPQSTQVPEYRRPQRVLPTIRILDAGLTPRAPLRYRVPPGASETVYLELVRAQALRVGNEGGQSGMPPIQLQVQMGPSEPTPEGFIRHPLKITQLRIANEAQKMSPAQREQMEKTLAPLLHVEGWSEMDIQGRVRRSEFRGLEDVPPDLIAMLGNIRTALLTVPFPDEPLGVRSRWEVERKIQLSGFWADQVATYHIVKMDRNQIELQIAARQSATPQSLANGRLEAYQVSVIGSAVVRLDSLSAFSEAEATSQMRIQQRTGSGSQLLQVDSRTMVRLYPADAGKPLAEEAPEQDAVDQEDANVITDPGKQKLKWR
ncbi:MAG TPA: hypothetical protein VFG22_14240 [Polyangiales bacterium]|nr:hypothetical protein [Polyangiales bacterium]